MKRFLILIGAIICFSLSSRSQTVIDLTTGTDLVGDIDPIWKIQYPDATDCWPLTISTGLVEFENGFVNNSYMQDPCGQWLSPFISPFTNNIVKGPAFSGTYTYKAEVYVDHCEVYDAWLDFSLMLADNSLTDVRINGTSYPLPAGITFLAPGSMSVPVTVTPGLNLIEVDVHNESSFTGLQLCGDLTVNGGPPCYPEDLSCCDAPVGQILSWTEVEDAVGYEIEFNWNDPDCCDYEGPLPIVTIVNSDDNVFLYYPGTGTSDCFSWRVRTVFADGSKSEYTEKECSCMPICETPSKLKCKVGNQVKFNWSEVAGASFYDFVITYNDPECCPGGPVSTLGFSVLTNTITRPYIESCFSWKVRAHCSNGGVSGWSEVICGCPLPFSQTPSTESTTNRASLKDAAISASIVPNPANEFVTITLTDKSNISELKDADLILFDISGREIYKSSIPLNGSKRIDVSQFESGIYILNIINNGEMVTSDKLVIQ